ncbi:unnamed protein product [Fraxinus pennsylvanica]|uniref:Uncharacterized protein n=1 Tax=Fraxinus pennsylvanica TaxID=56036 RepID=A0AAD2E1F2_9LAMI|nr:unnamed protein product [Fraxinus pennsylvanica]
MTPASAPRHPSLSVRPSIPVFPKFLCDSWMFLSWFEYIYINDGADVVALARDYVSSSVQRQYHQKFGLNEMIPVAANDVAFSIHAVLLTAFTLFQVVIYDLCALLVMAGKLLQDILNFR